MKLPTLILKLQVRLICVMWLIVLIGGIILVHGRNGRFIVGSDSNGVEYSVLLIFALILIYSHEEK